MKTLAILLDTRPGYLRGIRGPASVLMAPLGPATVLQYLARRLASLGHVGLTIATDFEPEGEYTRRIEDAGERVDGVIAARDLAEGIGDYEPSDWLLIMDPRCVPAVGLAASAVATDGDGHSGRARHLVALEAHSGGTVERVEIGANGTVGRIRRYYDSATWPFTSGTACSVMPVSSTIGESDLDFTSLRALRRGLADRGVPSSDVFIRGGAFDLTKERDLLALSERLVIEHFARRGRTAAGQSWLQVGAGCDVDSSARLVGPVVLQDGASIGAEAIVAGPAVIGARARLEREAVIAQCVVGADAVVPARTTLRHRAVFGAEHDAGEQTAASPAPDAFPAPAFETSEVEDRRGRTGGFYPVLKALFDVTASALGLVLLSPLLVLIAVLVKLESKGPVFYGDRREGKGSRPFRCLKFRTMCAGADAQQRELLARNQVDGPQFKMARDPRVTRVGRVLRTLSLDELPQLINVVLLQMSLVGPRPSPFRENQLCVPWRDGRLSVRPGITGLWQICRHRRGQGDFHQWIHFDLLYVRHMSLLVDLKILAATLVSLGGQWPVPLSWIVSARHQDGTAPGRLLVKVRSAPPVLAEAAGNPTELRVSSN